MGAAIERLTVAPGTGGADAVPELDPVKLRRHDMGLHFANSDGHEPDRGEPTGEPTVTDIERRQAASSQYRCSWTARQATSSAFWRPPTCAF